MTTSSDVEKRAGVVDSPPFEDETRTVPASYFKYGDSIMNAKLRRQEGKLEAEQRDIEPVPEDKRADSSYRNIGSTVLPSRPLCKMSLMRTNLVVVGCEYGCAIIHHRRLGQTSICNGVHRFGSCKHPFQFHCCVRRPLLLPIRLRVRTAVNVSHKVLVWLMECQASYFGCSSWQAV